jgi:outer membrane murein-binding lipoprotein Lpp
VRAKELLISAQRTGIEADPRAGRLFRLAAVRLSTEPTDSEGQRAAAAEAGAALVGLALAENEEELLELLTPDPTDRNVVWTVACYQIGDLTPSALRDFPDPVEAVATVAACPDETHVAAELVASTAGGLRWTAVLRTNDHLSVQLPTPDTASDGSREHPGDLAAALRRWRERLAAWADNGGNPSDEERSRRGSPDAVTTVVSTPPASAGRAPIAITPAMSVAYDDRFASFEQSINVRLARLETNIAAMAASVEAANAAAARRDETVRQLESELLAARTSGARPVLVHEQIELLQGTIDLRFRALAACFNDAVARFDEVAAKLARGTDRGGDDVTTSVQQSAEDVQDAVRRLEARVVSQLSDEVRLASGAIRAHTDMALTRVDGLSRRLGDVVNELGDTTTIRFGELTDRVAELIDAAATPDGVRPVADALRAELAATVEPMVKDVGELHRALFGAPDA